MRSTVADVMTREVVTVDGLAPFKEVVRLMRERRVSALPVVDPDGALLGIVSEGDLILKEDPALWGRGRRFEGRRRVADRAKAASLTAWELMTTHVISIGLQAPIGEAARRMHRHSVKRLPVLDAAGQLVGIVSRADILKVFLREDAEIAREIRDEVIRRTLWIEPDTIRVVVRDGVVTLQGQVERRGLLPVIERLVGTVDGVVRVEDRLSYIDDDRVAPDLSGPWTSVVPRTGR